MAGTNCPAGESFSKVDGAIHWWIGDWLLAGAKRYERGQYEEALEALGFEKKTLNDDRWVAQKVECSRRRELLSWAHHQEVAALSPDEQTKWLDRAEENGWGQKELRKQVRDAHKRDALAAAAGRNSGSFGRGGKFLDGGS